MIDPLEALRLAFDTGILTLIWLVQLVIYPGLTRYSQSNLKSWHPIYSKRVTYVVLPLMLGQLVLSIYHAIIYLHPADIVHLVLILSAWAITFFKAVPLHQSIEDSNEGLETAIKLKDINKSRTAVWSITWILSLYMLMT